MAAKIDPDDPVIIAQFEEHGEEQVRLLMLTAQWPTTLNQAAMKWLKKKTHESRAANDAAQAEQNRTARIAKNAAIIAAIAAAVTVALAIVSIIETWFMWRHPHGS